MNENCRSNQNWFAIEFKWLLAATADLLKFHIVIHFYNIVHWICMTCKDPIIINHELDWVAASEMKCANHDQIIVFLICYHHILFIIYNQLKTYWRIIYGTGPKLQLKLFYDQLSEKCPVFFVPAATRIIGCEKLPVGINFTAQRRSQVIK